MKLPAIEISQLNKFYGKVHAVNELSLQIEQGEIFGFLGPNGAGKTTMIRMLLGLTHASAGTMSLLGRPVPAERAGALQEVATLGQDAAFRERHDKRPGRFRFQRRGLEGGGHDLSGRHPSLPDQARRGSPAALHPSDGRRKAQALRRSMSAPQAASFCSTASYPRSRW